MRIAIIISAALYGFLLSTTVAQAAEVLREPSTQDSAVKVRPITRNSTDVFDVLEYFIKANERYQAQDFQSSYEGFSIVVLHDPDNIQALMGLGNSALEINKNEMALKSFERLGQLPLTPEQSLKRYAGHVLAAVRTHPSLDTEAHLMGALEEVPSDFRIWNALGQFYDGESRWKDSFEAYKKAHEAGFSKTGFHNNLGMSFLRQEKYKGAISNFTYAAALDPTSKQYDNNRRYSLLISGNYIEALKSLDENQAAHLLSDAGYIAIQKEDFGLARRFLEKAIDISPTYNQRAALALKKLELIN